MPPTHVTQLGDPASAAPDSVARGCGRQALCHGILQGESGWPLPPPAGLPDPGILRGSPAQVGCLRVPGKPNLVPVPNALHLSRLNSSRAEAHILNCLCTSSELEPNSRGKPAVEEQRQAHQHKNLGVCIPCPCPAPAGRAGCT